MKIKDKLKSFFFPENDNGPIDSSIAQPKNSYVGNILNDVFDGSPFPGAFGDTKINWTDYYTLRLRSKQLFQENLYCRGIIRRLLTNEIHTGLNLESHPIAKIIGLTEDQAIEWSDDREIDWNLWANDPIQCDWQKKSNLTQLSNERRQTALISGDCLVIQRINKKTGLPAIQLVDGRHIKTPFGEKPRAGNKIIHGVEVDKNGRHMAFWVQQPDSGNFKTDEQEFNKIGTTFKRIPAFGEKTGRKIAWLTYGTEKTKLDDVRGEPILAIVLYMMKELDTYRSSEQRSATVNALLAYFIERDPNSGIGTQPVDSTATRKGSVDITQPDGSTSAWNYAKGLPGAVMQHLGKGEKPVPYNPQRPNVNFGKFEEVIIDAFSWLFELPPEILRLKFQSNFSASRQADNEFRNYLKKAVWQNGNDFYQPIYETHTIMSVANGRFEAPGLLESWRDAKNRNTFNAWLHSEWTGLSRQSVDFKKDVDGGAKAIDYGFTTQDQQCRKLSGLSFRAVLQTRKREIEEAKKAGVSFASEEDQNRNPIVPGGENIPEGQEGNDITNIRIKKMENLISEIQEKFEDMEEMMEVANG
jgi:capsid protein